MWRCRTANPGRSPIQFLTAVWLLSVGQTYEIKNTAGDFDDGTNVGGIDLTETPWWDPLDTTGITATLFASVVGKGLGMQNTLGEPLGYTWPFFAFQLLGEASVNVKSIRSNIDELIGKSWFRQAFDGTYAYAELLAPHPESVPAPLPVFGAAAAFGYSRRLRKRITRSKNLPLASAID